MPHPETRIAFCCCRISIISVGIRDIVATQTCPCEIEHPSWHSADALYQRLAVDMDATEISTLRQAVQEEIGRVQKKSLDICRAWRAR